MTEKWYLKLSWGPRVWHHDAFKMMHSEHVSALAINMQDNATHTCCLPLPLPSTSIISGGIRTFPFVSCHKVSALAAEPPFLFWVWRWMNHPAIQAGMTHLLIFIFLLSYFTFFCQHQICSEIWTFEMYLHSKTQCNLLLLLFSLLQVIMDNQVSFVGYSSN